MKLPTQSDIAELAGVSRATVSYVLSGRSGGAIRITDQTRERILTVAEELGYQPNAAALSLRSSITRNIGITIPDLSNPHMQAILCGATETAQRNDYNILLVSTGNRPEYERMGIRELLRRSIDGLILVPTFVNILEEEYRLLAKLRSPVVVAGNYYDHLNEIDTVIPGHDQGAEMLMDHLIALGHRRIGFILGVQRKPLGSERLEIYKQKQRLAGIRVEEKYIIESGIRYQNGYAAGKTLMEIKPRPTAILAINDVIAVGAVHAVLERGLRIPEDISIAGFDDNDYSAYMNPALTTVDVKAYEIGSQCVKMVIKRIERFERPYDNLRIPCELKVRGSTGVAA
jgi:DNA-binding LacI/PurR family transcriptional regulator